MVLPGLLLFYPTWFRLFGQWLQFEQVLAHGLVTGLLFLGLLLYHPPVISQADHESRNHNLAGVLFLLMVTLAWALVELVRIDTLSYLLLPVGLIAVTWSLRGWQAARAFSPYILLLSLSLPVWADFIPTLVRIASAVVGQWVQWFGMTAVIEGSSITLPYGRLVIADGCSGIRYFAISILLAMMISILNDYRWRGWLTALTIGIALALLANWVRIFILVLLGYQTQMQSSLLTDHELMGWAIFAAFILPALYLSPAIRRPTTSAPVVKWSTSGMAAVLAAFIIGPLALAAIQPGTANARTWQPEAIHSQSTRPDDLPIPLMVPETLTHQVWQTPDKVWISLAQKAETSSSREKLVPYIPPLIERDNWVRTTVSGNVNVYQHLTSRRQVALLQWYRVGSYQANSYRRAKLLQIPATFSGESRFALVTLMAECAPLSCNEAIQSINLKRQSLRLEPTR